MNVQTETITLLTIKKTEAEWRQVLANPQPFQDELRDELARLRSGHEGEAQGDAIRKAAAAQNDKRRDPNVNRFLATTPRGKRRPPMPTGSRMKGKKAKTQPCPAGCGRDIAVYFIPRHLKKAHPGYVQPADASASSLTE